MAGADELATHFAQNYRSGHVLNFVLAALAVIIGLAGFLLPGSKLALAAIEFLLALAIILNTRLRGPPRMAPALARLSPAGRAAAAAAEPQVARDRRARPAGKRGQPGPAALGRMVCSGGLARERLPGGQDHSGCGACACRLDRDSRGRPAGRLSPGEQPPDHAARPPAGTDQRGGVLDDADCLGRDHRPTCLGAGLGRPVEPLADSDCLPGLPTIGAAVFGIRFQGDFGGSALRSDATAAALGRLVRRSCAPTASAWCAPPTLASRRRGRCSPTSPNGGWSTSSMTCRSARKLGRRIRLRDGHAESSPGRARRPACPVCLRRPCPCLLGIWP